MSQAVEAHHNPTDKERLAASGFALLAAYGDFVHSFEEIKRERTTETPRSPRNTSPITPEDADDAADPSFMAARISILLMEEKYRRVDQRTLFNELLNRVRGLFDELCESVLVAMPDESELSASADFGNTSSPQHWAIADKTEGIQYFNAVSTSQPEPTQIYPRPEGHQLRALDILTAVPDVSMIAQQLI